jgi:hypothetical protein
MLPFNGENKEKKPKKYLFIHKSLSGRVGRNKLDPGGNKQKKRWEFVQNRSFGNSPRIKGNQKRSKKAK